MTVQRPAGAGDLRVYFGPKGDGRIRICAQFLVLQASSLRAARAT